VKDVSFGQYYPVDSVGHRLDPRMKLLLTVMYIVMVFFVNTFIGYGVVAVFLFVLILCSRVPPLKVLRSIRAIIFLVFFTGILNLLLYKPSSEAVLPLAEWWRIKIYKDGIITAGRMALRLVLLVLGPALLTLTTTPVALTSGIESALKPLKLIKFPVHALAMIMSIALRLIPTLMEETDKIMRAQKARAADFESGNLIKKAKALLPVLIPLFVNSFRRADELAVAMDSRCYRGAKGRTKMKKLKFAGRDLGAFLLFASMFAGLVLLWYAVRHGYAVAGWLI